MRVTKNMLLALTHIEWVRKTDDGKGYITFSRKVTYATMKRLEEYGYITPYKGEEGIKFKLTDLGKSVLA